MMEAARGRRARETKSRHVHQRERERQRDSNGSQQQHERAPYRPCVTMASHGTVIPPIVHAGAHHPVSSSATSRLYKNGQGVGPE